MLDLKLQFLCYALAVACFLLAALEGSGGTRGLARGPMAQVSFVPLGLAFFVFPLMWNTGAAAF